MLSTTIKLATKILDEARAEIQANMAKHYRTSRGERWINASGRSSEAFKVEVDGSRVRLVYRGDDVAPLASIQEGTTGVAPVAVLEQWIRDKGLHGLNPWAVRQSIKKRGGTERHDEHQDWIVAPVVEEAVRKLKEELRAAAVRDFTEQIFGN